MRCGAFSKKFINLYFFFEKVLNCVALIFPNFSSNIFLNFSTKKKAKIYFWIFHENEKSLIPHRSKISKSKKKQYFWIFPSK